MTKRLMTMRAVEFRGLSSRRVEDMLTTLQLTGRLVMQLRCTPAARSRRASAAKATDEDCSAFQCRRRSIAGGAAAAGTD